MSQLLNRKTLISLLGILIIYAVVQATSVLEILPPFLKLTLILICIYIILSTSLNLITGITGQFSIGHAGFMSIGAYTSAVVGVKLHGSLGVALLAGAIAAGVAGLLVGLPTLRLKGDYLAIATLGFGEIVWHIIVNVDYLGGSTGFNGIPRHITWNWAFWLMVFSVVAIKNFVNSTHGRACISIRENEIAAESMGINTTKYKVIAFIIGSFFAGLAGGIYANYMYTLQAPTFNFLLSFNILVMVVLGGMGSLTGSVIGAVLMTMLNYELSNYGLGPMRYVITAVLLVVLMIFRPSGIMGNKEFSLNFLGKKGEKNGLA